jgi:hypothetical protein
MFPTTVEFVVRLTIVVGVVTNDHVGAVLKSPGVCGEDCGGGGKGKGEEGIGTPAEVCAREDASDIACASVSVRVVVDPPARSVFRLHRL